MANIFSFYRDFYAARMQMARERYKSSGLRSESDAMEYSHGMGDIVAKWKL